MSPLPGQQSLFPERMTAHFSVDRVHRYTLVRVWRPDRPLVNFVMLNPSTADETNDDPSIRRCLGYADTWGSYGGLIVTNLFAVRSTDPSWLKQARDPIGPDNDHHILESAQRAHLVVCAWGNHGNYISRAYRVVKLLHEQGIKLHYLRLLKNGQPSHPLYLPALLQPQLWETASVASRGQFLRS